MKVLVFLEHSDGVASKGSLGVLSKAAALAPGAVGAVLVGPGPPGDLPSELGGFGAATVYIEDGRFEPPHAQAIMDVVEHVISSGGYDTVLFSNSVLAADVAAGVAVRVGAGLNWDLVDVGQQDGEFVGKRPAVHDSLLIDVVWRSARRLAIFRAGAFSTEWIGGESQVEKVSCEPRPHARAVRIVGQQRRHDSAPSLQDASVIVGGGIGLGSADAFRLAEDLAELLSGEVGATRAAVYKGWYPHSAQIGQTGKTVTPDLYVALGISGAVQHKVGMHNAKTIISINTDPTAPIFDVSDLGIVGDLHVIVPELIGLLRSRTKASS